MNDNKTSHSDGPRDIIKHLVHEGIAAISYYQVYSVLRKKEYLAQQEILGHGDFKDYFHASHTAHFKMIFITLGKIFDKDPKAASMKELIKALKKEEKDDLVTHIENKLGPQTDIHKRIDTIKKIEEIRNKSIAHNQRNPSKKEIYENNPVERDELGCFIGVTCEVINHLASKFDLSGISTSGRAKRSMLKILDVLMAAT